MQLLHDFIKSKECRISYSEQEHIILISHLKKARHKQEMKMLLLLVVGVHFSDGFCVGCLERRISCVYKDCD